MGWPTFMATLFFQKDVYWYKWFPVQGLLHQPRSMKIPLRSLQVHTDATPDALGIYILSAPPRLIHQPLQPPLPIAEAEIAAALHALITITEVFHNPVNITLYTDSEVAYYTLMSGKGCTFRNSLLFQQLYALWFRNKVNSGFGLVVRWIPSQANLADPVSRGVHAAIT
jgi:hypothetical protein